jgi:peptidoglycan/LPS O-acetylase OafA/YrhL
MKSINKNAIKTDPLRLVGIDFLRVGSAIMIFLFHTSIHLACNYGIFQPFISNGAVFMVAFFMLSGFSLYYVNRTKDFTNRSQLIDFYFKRIKGIYPVYFVIVVAYFLLNDSLSIFKKIMLIPLDILFLQSQMEGAFSVSHYGGTWFISCIAVSYFCFPYLITFLKNVSRKKLLIALVLLWSVCSYASVLSRIMDFSWVYPNPFFRLLEFICGMICAEFQQGGGKNYQ